MFSPILLSLHSRDMWNGLGAEAIELSASSSPPAHPEELSVVGDRETD